MAKPVILVVEPDPEVLWAIKDDVQREDRFRYTSGLRRNRLETLKQLKECKECMTLL